MKYPNEGVNRCIEAGKNRMVLYAIKWTGAEDVVLLLGERLAALYSEI